jgi:hypothetical protein
MERCREWSSASTKWRMFYVVFELLSEKQFSYKVEGDQTVFDRVTAIL